jgi:hypothetical protein
MPTTSTDRQRKHRQKMKTLNLTLVQVWVPQDRVLELRSTAARMQEEGSRDSEPSDRQLAFAQFLCDTKGLTLTQEQLSSSKKLFRWLNENRNKSDRVKGECPPLNVIPLKTTFANKSIHTSEKSFQNPADRFFKNRQRRT